MEEIIGLEQSDKRNGCTGTLIQVNMNDTLVNPHEKLFRETWSNIDVAKDYQNNYLPGPLLKRIDLDSLEESQYRRSNNFVRSDLHIAFVKPV